MIREALRMRAERPDAFAGRYEPLDAGPDVCAFRRGDDVLVAPRRPGAGKPDVAPRGWRDLLGDLRVGLLMR